MSFQRAALGTSNLNHIRGKVPNADTLPTVLDTGLVQVVSDVDLTVSQAQMMADSLVDAWRFDLRMFQWTNPPLLRNEPVKLLAISQALMRSRYGGIAGGAVGRDTMIASVESFARPNIVAILAHELSHIQSTRAGGGLPRFMEEGKAQALQLRYLRSLGLSDGGVHGRTIAQISPMPFRESLDSYTYGPTQRSTLSRDQTVGGFFTDFVRTRFHKGHYTEPGLGDYPDTFPRIATMIEELGAAKKAGRKPDMASFRAAFQNAFEIDFKTAKEQCLSLIRNTEGNGAERVRGTAYLLS